MAQRMLIKRPTVARISDVPILSFGSRPTRASEPRTKITRPRGVTIAEPDLYYVSDVTMDVVAAQTVKSPRPKRRRFGGTNTFEAPSVHILPGKGGVDALAIGGDVATH